MRIRIGRKHVKYHLINQHHFVHCRLFSRCSEKFNQAWSWQDSLLVFQAWMHTVGLGKFLLMNAG